MNALVPDFKAPPIDFVRTLSSGSTNNKAYQVYLHFKRGDVAGAHAKDLSDLNKDHPAVRGELGSKLVVHHSEGGKVFFGFGSPKRFDHQEASEWGENLGHFLLNERIAEFSLIFPDEVTDQQLVFNFLKGISLAGLKLQYFKTGDQKKNVEFKKISVVSKLAGVDLNELKSVVRGVAFARCLSELPQRNASPEGIIEIFKEFLDKRVLEMEVWDEKKIAKEKMGLLQAVSQGSHLPPRFLIVRYNTNLGPKVPHAFLVGKGVTFDTGGVNLKTVPWRDLVGMKRDMSGASAVLGAMIAIAGIRPHLRVTALVPMTTNSIDSRSIIPGDIVTSYSGKTVEIGNTDAEGRLILADAVHYAKLQKADYIIDVATLTGACAIALGAHHSGLFTNNDNLGSVVTQATRLAGEPIWPMPTSPRYGDEIKSSLADISNMGKARDGGASIGAKFIEAFVDHIPWAHLDIAGAMELGEPASSGAQVKSSGRMAHGLVEVVKLLAGAEKQTASTKKKK